MVVYFHPEFPFIAPNPWLLVLLHIVSVVWGTWMFHQVLFPIFPVKGINNDCINFLYSSSIQTMQWNAISLRITARSIECMNSTCCTEIVFSLMGVISVTRDVAFTLKTKEKQTHNHWITKMPIGQGESDTSCSKIRFALTSNNWMRLNISWIIKAEVADLSAKAKGWGR